MVVSKARAVQRLVVLPVLVFMLVAVAAPVAAQGVTVGVIDEEKILLESERGKAALQEIDALRKQKDQERQAKEQELKDLQARFTEGRLSLSEDKLAELRKQIEDKAIALQRFQDDATRELTKKRNEVLDEIEKSVFPVINQIGQEGGYTLIFNKFHSGLVYAAETVDITDRVIERYNQSTAGQAGQ